MLYLRYALLAVACLLAGEPVAKAKDEIWQASVTTVNGASHLCSSDVGERLQDRQHTNRSGHAGSDGDPGSMKNTRAGHGRFLHRLQSG